MSEQGQPESPGERLHEEETRLERTVRYGHRTRLYLILAFGVAALVFLVLLIARNTRQVRVDYVVGHSQTALIWLVVISAIIGWVLGMVTAFLVRRRTRPRRSA